MFEHKGPLLNFSPQHHINGKGEKFKLGTCQRGKFSEAAQSCDTVVFSRRSKEISVMLCGYFNIFKVINYLPIF